MLGTLNGALEVRGISLGNDHIKATAEGFNQMEERLVRLRRINVHYDLVIPPGTRDKVDRALSTHAEKCSTAQSLKGAVAVTWTADIRETSDVPPDRGGPGEGAKR